MAAAVGITAQGVSGSTTAAVTTTAATTQVSGSDFYVVVFAGTGVTFAGVAPVITDNMGNNAKWATALIGTQFSNGNTQYGWRFVCPNGSGGAGHTITATFGGLIAVVSIVLIELTGCALASPIDQSNTGTTGASTGPATSGNITIAPPASGDVMISAVFVNNGSTNLVFTEANGFTIQQFDGNFAARPLQWAVATRIVTAANTYSAAYSWGGANIFTGSFIDSVKGAAAGGGGGSILGPVGGLFGIGNMGHRQ